MFDLVKYHPIDHWQLLDYIWADGEWEEDLRDSNKLILMVMLTIISNMCSNIMIAFRYYAGF